MNRPISQIPNTVIRLFWADHRLELRSKSNGQLLRWPHETEPAPVEKLRLFFVVVTTENRRDEKEEKAPECRIQGPRSAGGAQGGATINEIARENDVAPTQVSAWKRELESRVDEIFKGKGEGARELARKEAREVKLERKVCQLVIEKEFLEKKVRAAGGRPQRKAMIERENRDLSIRRQCELLDVTATGSTRRARGSPLRTRRSW